MNETKQIILMRTDLNMRKGKMCAQAAHASMKVLLDAMECISDKIEDSEFYEIDRILTTSNTEPLSYWLAGNFTKVCVAVTSEEELLEIIEKAKERNLLTSIITDSGKTEFNGVPTITCGAIGPAFIDQFAGLTDNLKLL